MPLHQDHRQFRDGVVAKVAGHPIGSRYLDGQLARCAMITCHGCGVERLIALHSTKRADNGSDLAERKVSRALTDAGWKYKTGLRHPTCPDCQPKPQLRLVEPDTKEPEAMRHSKPVVPANIDDVRRVAATIAQEAGLPPPMQQGDILTSTAAPPLRTRTLADNRRIMLALDGEYDQDKGRYRGESSDESVATGLNVPRAWVTDTRTQFFGVGEGNDLAAKATLELATLRNDLLKMEALLEGCIGEQDRISKKIDAIERGLKR